MRSMRLDYKIEVYSYTIVIYDETGSIGIVAIR